MINVIEFVRVPPSESGDEAGSLVNIRIDSRWLSEIMREVEAAMASAEGRPELAGAYRPTVSASDAEAHFLRRIDHAWGESEAKSPLLDCECGCAGCWPLLCEIEVRTGQVRWISFEQPHRGPKSKASFWNYSSFAGFTFDRDQYAAALATLTKPQNG